MARQVVKKFLLNDKKRRRRKKKEVRRVATVFVLKQNVEMFTTFESSKVAE